MRNNGIGGVEHRSATFTIFTRSLDDYINEVIASKMGMKIEGAKRGWRFYSEFDKG